MGRRYRRMEDRKPWCGLPNLKSENVKNWETCVSELVSLKRTTDEDLGAKPPETEQFFEKQVISNAIESHSGRAQSHLKELDF